MARWNRLDYPGATIWIEGASDWQGYRSGACRKEPWTVAFLESLDPERDCLHNVGANVGSYALIAAARGVLTVAYEPHPTNYAALCVNTLTNEVGGQLRPYPIALGNWDGAVPLHYRTLAGGSAGVTVCPTPGDVRRELPALMSRLDTVLSAKPTVIPWPPTHLLIDVDGAELGVLQGAEKTLPGVKAVLIELARDSHATDECVDLLNRAGLTLTKRYTDREGQPIPEIWYGLFERG